MDPLSPSELAMRWHQRPRTVLLVAKHADRDPAVANLLGDIASWLSSKGVVVVLEPGLLQHWPLPTRPPSRARTFSSEDRLEKSVDLIVTLAGDGALMRAAKLFRGAMPPVLAFTGGSQAFLAPFELDSWRQALGEVFCAWATPEALPLVCRMRLVVRVHSGGGATGRGGGSLFAGGGDDEESVLESVGMNEVLVHRGESGSLTKLEVRVDGELITLAQGDGLILATPTGSTAYSLSAGGCMVHPSVPAILLTPVAPHSLSFRPALLPQAAVVSVSVPASARSGARLSVDGRDMCSLERGDRVEVRMSAHPVPTLCHLNGTRDWFTSVHDALNWNGR